jgi:phage terminase large subunit
MDYGFDMLAALLMGIDERGNLFAVKEVCIPELTLGAAAIKLAELCRGYPVEYVTASPDLWNRRQDTGKSGFEIMQAVSGVPPLIAADNRRIPGWRILREYLSAQNGSPTLQISAQCATLIRSLPALLCDPLRVEDASDSPHEITHAPEALRYAVMSRSNAFCQLEAPDHNFHFPKKTKPSLF